MDLHRCPKTSDGKQIFLPNIFPGIVQLCYAGQGDEPGAGTYSKTSGAASRFKGPDFQIGFSSGGPSTKSVEWRFLEWVYLAGGSVKFVGADLGDTVELEVNAPASPATSVDAGTGNAGKFEIIPSSGLHMIVPGPLCAVFGVGKDWDVDLTELEEDGNEDEIPTLTKVVPVPAPDGDGCYDWDEETYAVSENLQGKGAYNLFDFAMNLGLWTPGLCLLGSGLEQMETANIKTKRMLPQWTYKVTAVSHDPADELKIVWRILIGRKNITKTGSLGS
ncbi:MAG: hypothetical protein AMJ46_14000 [Latescibacteria bacterium DG_63]|nr:MAG: hypothetical protein AMJ46_14000 [Latescibacteria bacterium DG_63]